MKQKQIRPVWTRRQFTATSVLALFSGVSVTIGCGGGGSSSPSSPTPPLAAGDKGGVVSANHGHSAIVRSAELMAGGPVNLDIRGASDHPHTVRLSADQVVAIAAGTRVTVRSSVDDAHDHEVTFN